MEKKNIWLAIGIIVIIIAVIYLVARPSTTLLPEITPPGESEGEQETKVTEPTPENTTPEAVGQELEQGLDLGDIDNDLKEIDTELQQIEGF